MKIILLSEDAIRLEPDSGPMTIEALEPEQQYSAFHMIASSLASCTCTISVMYSWASTPSNPPTVTTEADGEAYVPSAQARDS